MDIRTFFGAGGLKKDVAKKQQDHISKKPPEKSEIKELLPGKSSATYGERSKSSGRAKKDEEKIVRDMSDEEVDFKKIKKRSRSMNKKIEEGKGGGIEKGRYGGAGKGKDGVTGKVKELSTDRREEDKKKNKKMEMKRKVSNDDEEEDEDVMNVKKKHKPIILDSDSEEEEEEDPLPRSMRGKRKGSLNSPHHHDSTHTTSIVKAFTKVVPKQPAVTKALDASVVKRGKEPRALVSAVDFFGSEPVTSGEVVRKGRDSSEKRGRDVEKGGRDVEKRGRGVEKKDSRGGGEDGRVEKDDRRNALRGTGAKVVNDDDDDDEEEDEDVVVVTPAKTLAEKLALKKSMGRVKEGAKEGMKEERGVKEGAKEGMKKKEERGVIKKESEGEKEWKKEEKKVKKEEMKKGEDTGRKEEKKRRRKTKSEEEDDVEEEEEKKKKMKMAYMAFMHREPPKALGSREMPQGEENCLEGLTFVLTGVYETVERDDVKRLLERLGAKVTTSVSRNTSYLVVGRDPGASKVDKAKQLGTKNLDEDALFSLISKLPGKKSKYEIQAEKEAHVSTPKSTKKSTKSPMHHTTPSSSSSKSTPSTTSKKATTSTTTTPVTHKPPSTPSSMKPSTSHQSSTTTTTTQAPPSLLWTDKYRPVSVKGLVGQQGPKSQANKLMAWLQNWHKNSQLKAIFGRANDEGVGLKAALLSGPPGVGKTTTAQVVCKELSFSYVELNASDTRSKRSLKEEVAECLNNQSLVTLFGGRSKESGEEMTRHCLVMDEVDGMSGNEDRGGVQELIQLIKTTHIPIICLCNDRNHPKIRSLANHCFDLRFQRPRVEQIKSAIMSIAYKEGLKLPASCLNDVIMAANHDLRQILLNMSMWTVRQASPTYDEVRLQADNAKKDMHYSPFDVCRRVFSNEHERSKMTLKDKSDLFFHDYNIAPLFVHENYLSVHPTLARGDMKRHLALLSKAADSICEGDVVDGKVRKQQMWSLLPLQAMYASVLPGEYMRGGVGGMVQFPSWLGKNSTTNKNDRLLQELNLHTRISIKGNKTSLNQDYLPVFKHLLTIPLLRNDPTPAIDLMTSYDLLRDDLENIRELTNWSNVPDLFAKVDSKTKASLTRQFNKQAHLTPYSTSTLKKAAKRKMTEDGDEEEEDGADEGDDNDDPAADAMIVSKKASKAKQPTVKEAPKKSKTTSKEKKKK